MTNPNHAAVLHYRSALRPLDARCSRLEPGFVPLGFPRSSLSSFFFLLLPLFFPSRVLKVPVNASFTCHHRCYTLSTAAHSSARPCRCCSSRLQLISHGAFSRPPFPICTWPYFVTIHSWRRHSGFHVPFLIGRCANLSKDSLTAKPQ